MRESPVFTGCESGQNLAQQVMDSLGKCQLRDTLSAICMYLKDGISTEEEELFRMAVSRWSCRSGPEIIYTPPTTFSQNVLTFQGLGLINNNCNKMQTAT